VRRTRFVRRISWSSQQFPAAPFATPDLPLWAVGDVLRIPSTMSVPTFLGSQCCLFAFPVRSQTAQQEPLPGPDSHETGQGPHGHLFGDWGGERTRLQQYVSDSLWNLKSVQPERFASWNRFRGKVDIDFGELIGQQGLYFHATALWHHRMRQHQWQGRSGSRAPSGHSRKSTLMTTVAKQGVRESPGGNCAFQHSPD
jgi:hypothetical protein